MRSKDWGWWALLAVGVLLIAGAFSLAPHDCDSSDTFFAFGAGCVFIGLAVSVPSFASVAGRIIGTVAITLLIGLPVGWVLFLVAFSSCFNF